MLSHAIISKDQKRIPLQEKCETSGLNVPISEKTQTAEASQARLPPLFVPLSGENSLPGKGSMEEYEDTSLRSRVQRKVPVFSNP